MCRWLLLSFIALSWVICTPDCIVDASQSQVDSCDANRDESCDDTTVADDDYSCEDRCHDNYDPRNPCQCNDRCGYYGNCCHDYQALCADPDINKCGTLSEIAELLWKSDTNRLSPSDIVVDYQAQVEPGSTAEDHAPGSFFTKVDESKLGGPTFSAFVNLLDNYNPVNIASEDTNSHETNEVSTFLDAVLDTKVMAELMNFLICHGKVSSKSDFKAALTKIWFDFYQRGRRDAYENSSGFEHVLVGEYKYNGQVNGFHSWISFYLKEKAGDLNYLGYAYEKKPNTVIATFTWNGHYKRKGSFFIGVSPEFDLAIYTMCYVMKLPNNLCRVTLGGHEVTIITYDHKGQGKLATAFVF